MRSILAVFGIWLLLSANLYAQAAAPSLASEAETKNLADQFMSKIHGGTIPEAFDILKPFIPIPDTEFQNLQAKTSEKLEFIKPQFGKSLGAELFEEKRVKDFMIRYTYIQKFEHHVLRWFFVFYRPQDKWILNVFYWDDKAQDLF